MIKKMDNTPNISVLIEELISVLGFKSEFPMVLTDCNCDPVKQAAYNQARQTFNRKFDFRPAAIVFVENTKQVSEIVKFSNKYPTQISLRIRSGGHDHEGESNGTDTLLLDFTKLSTIEIERDVIYQPSNEKFKKLTVGPGVRFKDIKPILDDENIGIPHGTCETVAIAGFTMGGGWGPWTRLHGMACESLIGATIVLGDGSVEELSYLEDPKSNNGKLLWALRGGGGMSYGIVTSFVFKTFTLPEISFSFNIKFNQPFTINNNSLETKTIKITAIKVLELWEKAIAPDNFSGLIGTNLKIETAHLKNYEQPDADAFLKCQMNGYYGGTEIELKDFIKRTLGEKVLEALEIKQDRIKENDHSSRNYSTEYSWHFESWDRNIGTKGTRNEIGLDQDGPAPHKITSKLAIGNTAINYGWDATSRTALIKSLQSSKIPYCNDANLPHGVHTYITLGAISGDYYTNYDDKRDCIGSSFPYKDRPFTIQYQTWWNQFLDRDDTSCINDEQKIKESSINRPFVNRAEDWMEASRDYHIPHTSGAFISFKDASIPTSTYFSSSYDRLIKIKLDCSKDQNLLLRTRKTIL